MRQIEALLSEYGESHQNPTNQIIHKVMVPLIMFNVLGLLWAIPSSSNMSEISPWLNWSTIFASGCMIYYFVLSKSLFLGMAPVLAIMLFGNFYLDGQGILLEFSIVSFVIAWIMQFVGHKIEGKKPSFLKDLLFLLVGPLWVLRYFYRKIGIKI